ncbi:hypothetical protein p1B296 (plasmid) [Aromatoleum aromaticum EbN1]|uniref:Uncharacterized protein n=1 Tax=Aromatoleum aromaticum (strain DSM 19018 / LMG 30748 / EbN1) TaxID=76114 RepID=Q5NWU1_AROAE|nr:hypothetical protein p1B296 [Aromatoleum aromaticum EbN1]
MLAFSDVEDGQGIPIGHADHLAFESVCVRSKQQKTK